MLPRSHQPDLPAPEAALPDCFVPRDPRHLTILLVARLVTEKGDALARIRNVSTGGMMLEASLPLAVGEAVRIELRTLQAVEGCVVWATPPRAGIQFNTAVDIVELLHPLLPKGRNARVARAPRLATRCTVQVCHQGHSRHALLLDLSQGGGRVQGLRGVAVGDPLSVTIPGLAARKAVVRWLRDDDAGFVFLEPIPFAELDPWLQNGSLRFGEPA